MNPPKRYYHAVKIVPENCDGCMQCLRSCPTQALRIIAETPIIHEDLCIDCGACIMACPRKAVLPESDSVREMGDFKVKVAVPSPVLYAQFGLETSVKEIHIGLRKLGYDYVSDVFTACLIEAMALQEHLRRPRSDENKPLISAMCPAVVRLIQVNYPSLVKNVLPFEPPRELSAREAKIKVAKEKGLDIKDVGAFYISPCPAKTISVLQPAEKERSFLDGSVAITEIYKPLLQAVNSLTKEEIDAAPDEEGVFGSGWERTGFMSRVLNIRNWIAVSGLPHVTGILDDIESGKLDGVAFIEANACMEGCVGGSLCVENIYVARSKTLMLEDGQGTVSRPDTNWVKQLYDSGYFFMQRELHPRERKQPAPSISDAILLMKKRDELSRKLPGLNCCACGSPSCLTFAEDVVVHGMNLEACPYLDDSLKKK